MGQCHNPYPLCHNCSMLLTSVFADFAHLMLLHLVDHHATQLLLGVVVAQLLLVGSFLVVTTQGVVALLRERRLQ